MTIAQLRKSLAAGKCVFGTQQTMKNLKTGKVKKIYLASNCPPTTKRDIETYKEMVKVEIIQLNEPSDELMLICKKNFPVTVLSC